MGCVSMTVIGVGAHHNHEYAGDSANGALVADPSKEGRVKSRIPDQDANKLFEEFVDKLRAAGFSVEHASFTHGGRDYP
jgi:hypothetical protein